MNCRTSCSTAFVTQGDRHVFRASIDELCCKKKRYANEASEISVVPATEWQGNGTTLGLYLITGHDTEPVRKTT